MVFCRRGGDIVPKTPDYRLRANARYEQKQDRFALRFPAGDGQALRDAADRAGQSVNAYVQQAVKERIEREGK